MCLGSRGPARHMNGMNNMPTPESVVKGCARDLAACIRIPTKRKAVQTKSHLARCASEGDAPSVVFRKTGSNQIDLPSPSTGID